MTSGGCLKRSGGRFRTWPGQVRQLALEVQAQAESETGQRTIEPASVATGEIRRLQHGTQCVVHRVVERVIGVPHHEAVVLAAETLACEHESALMSAPHEAGEDDLIGHDAVDLVVFDKRVESFANARAADEVRRASATAGVSPSCSA